MLGLLLGTWFLVSDGASQAASSPTSELLGPEEQLALPEQLVASVQLPTLAEPIRLIRSDTDGIVVAVDIAGFEVEQQTVSGRTYDIVKLAGFGTSSVAGAPGVPSRRILLGIPLGAAYVVRVSPAASEMVPLQHRLLPAPTAILDGGFDPSFDTGTRAPGTASWSYVEDEQAYSSDALYPQAIAKVTSAGFIRDQRYIAVQLNPVQYNPVSGEVILHDQFTVEIDLTYAGGQEPDPGPARVASPSLSDGSYEPVLSGSLLNYESAANWRGKQSFAALPEVESLAEAVRDAAVPALKIMVNEDGIYEVTAAELAALDVPIAAVPLETYKLTFLGREVPIRIQESGGSFESFWFFGEKARTKYTDTNVYWLTYDPEPPQGADPGLRMDTRSVPTSTVEDISTHYSATVRLEEDLRYVSDAPWAGDAASEPVDESDHWFWVYTFYSPGASLVAFPTQLNGLSTSPFTATLRASMSGWTTSPANPEHCVEFYVNDELVGQHTWEDRQEELVSYPVSSAYLLEGSNSVGIRPCATDAVYDIIFYDWFELDVRRRYLVMTDSLSFDVAESGWQYRLDGFSTNAIELFDVTETYAVAHLIDAGVVLSGSAYSAAFYDVAAEEGTRYLALTHDQIKSPLSIVKHVPSNLMDPANHADYIVIAPTEFVGDVQPLVGHRMAQGLAVRVVELEPIFDEFNYGVYSPEAIRSFLAYAFHNWNDGGPPPAYVLLVGDGTYDYKGNFGHVNPNRLPPYLAWVDPWIGETAADNRYVAVAGDDPFPDMHVGRFPAETTTQLQTMVDKIIAYESNPAPPGWRDQVLFVADDPDPRAGDFYVYSDEIVNNYLPGNYVPIKAYYENTCLTVAECKQVILDTLNTTGALLVNYVGHGGPEVWTAEKVWWTDDLSSLEPTTRLPVMLPMTCWEGAFHLVKLGSFSGTVLGEGVVRIDGRGAVASWSATGEGYASGHDYLNKGFLRAALYEGVRELGIAADAGKARLFASGYYTDLLETYHLFGDPAMRLNSLDVVDVSVGQSIKASDAPSRGEVVTLTLSFTNTGPDVAAGVVLTDLLPQMLVTPTLVSSSPEVLERREGITLAWTLDDLPSGATGQVILTATVDPQWPEPEVSFFNVAEIGVETHDLVPENNIALVGVNIKHVYLPLILKGF
jgi:uncharacterized repeat protein (TIGR01451 family)